MVPKIRALIKELKAGKAWFGNKRRRPAYAALQLAYLTIEESNRDAIREAGGIPPILPPVKLVA